VTPFVSDISWTGVHSPTPSGITQLESYRSLFFPTVLVGDHKLGGISSTISSYESLLLRGYIVDSVLLFRDDLYRNWEYLTPYFAERNVPVTSFDPPPPQTANDDENSILTEKYYTAIVSNNESGGIFDVLHHLDDCHASRLSDLESMPRRTLDSIWWPFVQHGLVKNENDVTVIDSAYSDFFSVYNPRHGTSHQQSCLGRQFDGSASWWTQAIGHSHPSLSLAAARAAGRYGHVIFPQATHLPALRLAERLLRDGPGKGWASRAYFSDDGSTGMEIALKMALRAFSVRKGNTLDSVTKKTLGVLGLKGSYHGDTIGAMDACEDGVFTCEWHSAKGYWFDPPTVSIRKGRVVITLSPAIAAETLPAMSTINAESLSWVYDIPRRLNTPLADVYRGYIQRALESLQKHCGHKLAALVLEPLVMGAGGMIFVDPLFQRAMIDVVRGPRSSKHPPPDWSGLPVIFDEVFVGLYRLGLQSSAPLLGVNPDISVYAKILTGGLVPLAVTLASDAIYKSFLSEDKKDALLHGHSYSAHPVGCEVANATLDIVEKLASSGPWMDAQRKWTHCNTKQTVWSFWDPDFVNALSRTEGVAEVMTLGTVLAFKVKDETGGQCNCLYRFFIFISEFSDLKDTDQCQLRPSSHP
jgi:dethiobiotin synthetase/adenosylmethionine--8-amino-7-oxononanoate aminotransferase